MQKLICFGALSTERFIQEIGQVAVVRPRLFRTEAAAIDAYLGEGGDYEIVRVTIERTGQGKGDAP